MKKINFLALSMLASSVYNLDASENQVDSSLYNMDNLNSPIQSSPYALQASRTDSTNQLPPLLTRQAPSNSQISPIGDNLTPANIGAYITNIGNIISSMPTSPTNDQLITLQQSFENVKNSLLKLFPQMKEFRKPEDQERGKYYGQDRDQYHQNNDQNQRGKDSKKGPSSNQNQRGKDNKQGPSSNQNQRESLQYGPPTTQVIQPTINTVGFDNTTQIQS